MNYAILIVVNCTLLVWLGVVWYTWDKESESVIHTGEYDEVVRCWAYA